MAGPVLQFYEGMADEYHQMFADWRESVAWQGRTLDALIQKVLGRPAGAVLDCTCGIGTQAIGLATRGYRVKATDLSPAAVARALKEAESFGVALTGQAADLLTLDRVVTERFDVVLSGDNSLSHFFTDEDLHQAARQMRARLLPGGLLLATIRDYDRVLQEAAAPSGEGAAMQQLPGEVEKGRQVSTLPRVFDDANGRRIVFQVWDWAEDGRSYVINQYFVYEAEGAWRTRHHATRFRALLRAELTGALEAAGLEDVRWHMPAESGFYQPVVTARG